MIRLVLILILVVIVLAILLRRKQPPPLLTEIQPIKAKDEARPSLRAGEEGQEIANLPSEAGDSTSQKGADS